MAQAVKARTGGRLVAETLEAATEGAVLLAPRYEALPARVGLDAGETFVPPVDWRYPFLAEE